MSTRRQRRSPKWLKRQRQRATREGSRFAATQWIWFEGQRYAFDADHPEDFQRAIAETGMATVEVARGSIVFTAVEPAPIVADVGWPSITLDAAGVEITRNVDKLTHLVSKPERRLNRAQRRASGL